MCYYLNYIKWSVREREEIPEAIKPISSSLIIILPSMFLDLRNLLTARSLTAADCSYWSNNDGEKRKRREERRGRRGGKR